MKTLNKRTLLVLGCTYFLYSSVVHASGFFPEITVDGDVSDWAGVPVVLTDPAGDYAPADLINIKISNDDAFVYFLLEFSAPVTTYTYLHLDTDLDPSTGCNAFGMEYGVTFGVATGNLSYVGDAQDCSWGSADFSGALGVALDATGRFIEASIPISTLEVISPGLSGFNVNGNNDNTISARYDFLEGLPGCNLDLNLELTADRTLNLNFEISSDVPTTWTVTIAEGEGGYTNAWWREYLAASPIPMSVVEGRTNFPDFGVVGFLSTLTTHDGILCSVYKTIDTSIAEDQEDRPEDH